MLIKPGEGVGEFYLSKTTLKKIKSQLGKGEIEKLKWHAPHCGMTYPYYKLVYADKGISFTLYKKEVKQSDKFETIQLTEKFNAQTETQISIGRSTRSDIHKAYGQPTNKDTENYISYDNLGISFEFLNSKNLPTDTVTTINIFSKE